MKADKITLLIRITYSVIILTLLIWVYWLFFRPDKKICGLRMPGGNILIYIGRRMWFLVITPLTINCQLT
jgi:hypothetical protein